MDIRIRRAYDPPGRGDGARILVDRLWPRGVSKEALALDDWMKELAPSHRLRKWFGHDPARWEEFQRRYFAELDAQPEAVAALRARARERRLTLVYGARDPEHNDAVALRAYLVRRTRRPQRSPRA